MDFNLIFFPVNYVILGLLIIAKLEGRYFPTTLIG